VTLFRQQLGEGPRKHNATNSVSWLGMYIRQPINNALCSDKNIRRQCVFGDAPLCCSCGHYTATRCNVDRPVHRCPTCRLDIGDSPYAATCHIDSKNRPILWVWLRETRPESLPAKVVCGCLGVPRLLSYLPLPGKSLIFQAPIPEIAQLRGQEVWTSGSEPTACQGLLKVQGIRQLQVQGEASGHVDAEIILERCTPVAFASRLPALTSTSDLGSCYILHICTAYQWYSNIVHAVLSAASQASADLVCPSRLQLWRSNELTLKQRYRMKCLFKNGVPYTVRCLNESFF
jgi:hypothetical protein